MTVPSIQQRQAALDLANETRIAAATVKRHLGGMGRQDAMLEAARLLATDTSEIGTVKIHTFLVAIPRIGDVAVRKLLNDRKTGWYVWPFRRISELTIRQRLTIAAQLQEMAPRNACSTLDALESIGLEAMQPGGFA